jgi:outer membrane receptor protein involved in Fe transport
VDLCAADLAALGRTSAPPGAKPDSIWNYELGSKNTLLGGRLRVNAAIYDMNWSNIQLNIQLPTCAFSFDDNVGSARIRGGEVSLAGQLTQDLTLGATATYLDATITSATPGVQYRAGDELPNTPKHWYVAYAEWQATLSGSLSGFARADYQWRGNAVRDPSILSTEANYIYHAWDVANLSAGLMWPKWQLRLFLNNVFNKDPPMDFTSEWGQWRISTLRPRTIGINLSTQF